MDEHGHQPTAVSPPSGTCWPCRVDRHYHPSLGMFCTDDAACCCRRSLACRRLRQAGARRPASAVWPAAGLLMRCLCRPVWQGLARRGPGFASCYNGLWYRPGCLPAWLRSPAGGDLACQARLFSRCSPTARRAAATNLPLAAASARCAPAVRAGLVGLSSGGLARRLVTLYLSWSADAATSCDAAVPPALEERHRCSGSAPTMFFGSLETKLARFGSLHFTVGMNKQQ